MLMFDAPDWLVSLIAVVSLVAVGIAMWWLW